MERPVLRELACVERSVVLSARAVLRSVVGARKAQLAQPLRRAARPAAAGAPNVEAPPKQRPASCRAVRSSAASAPMRECEQEQKQQFGGLRGHGQCFSLQGNTRASPRPCEYAAPALFRSCAKAGIGRVRPMPAFESVASAACKCRKRLCSRNHRAGCEQNTVTANPSIEWTYNGGRPRAASAASRAPLYAAHVER
jgi:hypothetical protein